MGIFDGSNAVGLFKFTYSRKTFYQVVDPGVQVDYPIVNGELFKKFVKKVEEDGKRMLQLHPKRKTRSSTTDKESPSAAAKSTRIDISPGLLVSVSQSKRQKLLTETYWDSDEACKLFEPQANDSSCLETLQRRILLLQQVQKGKDGWRYAVKGRDPHDICTDGEKNILRQKSQLLCLAYKFAIDLMNGITWLACCEKACQMLNPIGITQASSGRLIAGYNRLFRTNNCFPHPNIDV